jgi:hypothetical protein
MARDQRNYDAGGAPCPSSDRVGRDDGQVPVDQLIESVFAVA